MAFSVFIAKVIPEVLLLLRHFVSRPTFLTIELSPDCTSQMLFLHNMETLGVMYYLKGMVRCRNRHFTVALQTEKGWIYIDDLCMSVRCFSSLQELLYNYCDGWFFAIFQKSECLDINLHYTANQISRDFSRNPIVCESVSKEACSINELKEEQNAKSFKKRDTVGFNNYMTVMSNTVE